MKTKSEAPKFEIHVSAKLSFTATVEADSLKEALEKASAMSYGQLFEDTPGEMLDSEHEITGVFKA